MIDAHDKKTQPLPIEDMPMKRKRGRPATGEAMTPAEKQRAYRERQKGLRDQNATIQAMDKELGALIVELDKAKEELRELRLRLYVSEKKWQMLLSSNEKLVETVRSQKEQLKSRDQKSNSGDVTKIEGKYIMQKKSPAGRWLKQCIFDSKKEADKAMVGVPIEMVHLYRIKKG